MTDVLLPPCLPASPPQVAAQRGMLRSSLLVLDEALQQLDAAGCAQVAGLLRGLRHDSVLVVGQAGGYAAQVFDVVDVVVKEGGGSRVEEQE